MCVYSAIVPQQTQLADTLRPCVTLYIYIISMKCKLTIKNYVHLHAGAGTNNTQKRESLYNIYERVCKNGRSYLIVACRTKCLPFSIACRTLKLSSNCVIISFFVFFFSFFFFSFNWNSRPVCTKDRQRSFATSRPAKIAFPRGTKGFCNLRIVAF